MALLSAEEIDQKLVPLRGNWKVDGHNLIGMFTLKNFPKAIEFVDQVAEKAEELWHHPDIDIRWNRVQFCLTTHDEKGLTIKDFELAKIISEIAGNLKP
jgi:4a-hydroxytetrahydrobiopterin dehydratase